MVDALREAHRVLTPSGVLIDVRPLIAPLVVEIIIATQATWSTTIESYSAPEDVAAADAAIQHAISREWLVFEMSLPFSFDIDCDSAADLRAYAAGRKLVGAEIPYQRLEDRRREVGADELPAGLRCRRPWMLSVYRKK